MGRLLDEDIVIDALIGISGSKSIEELTEECEVYQSDNRCYSGGVYGAIRAIKSLPTIQPVATDTNVGDTISRQAAIDALDCINGVEEVLRSLPPAQPELHEGHWIRTDCGLDVECKCSECGYRDFVEPRDEYWFKRNYCPNCGAKMTISTK